jgi:Ca2+/Na+ antiporter
VVADLIGSIIALLLGSAAYLRSRGSGGFYDRDVYGMTARTHQRYAGIAFAFAVAFAIVARWFAQSATIWLYAAFVLFAVFYLTSYLRGAHEDDE